MPMLEVRDLRVEFRTREGTVQAVNGVSYAVDERETVALVGESGCGKSVSVLSILRLVPQPAGRIIGGEVLFEGSDLLQLPDDRLREIRGQRIAMIFQDPMTSLNPLLTVGRQVAEALEVHQGLGASAARHRAIELLDLVGIPDAKKRVRDYPHQFSGGMRQRAMIAMALSCNPKLLIADEPTTALDVTTQAQIIDLVKRLRDTFGMAIIWITHDLGVVCGLADRVLVMYAGRIVESASANTLLADPRHPYTVGLLASVPQLDGEEPRRLVPIEGLPPELHKLPVGCPFAPRCASVGARCWDENPELVPVGAGHEIACWLGVAGGTGYE